MQKYNEVEIVMNALVPLWRPKSELANEWWMLGITGWALLIIPVIVVMILLSASLNKSWTPLIQGYKHYAAHQKRLTEVLGLTLEK